MYIAGYSIECRLKSKLMRMFNCQHLRELEDELRRRRLLADDATVFSHQLETLVRLNQGLDRLRHNQSLWRSFNIANRWVPAWRYSVDLSNQNDAEDFLEAVEEVAHWIDHNL
jgi:hypothetical protein